MCDNLKTKIECIEEKDEKKLKKRCHVRKCGKLLCGWDRERELDIYSWVGNGGWVGYIDGHRVSKLRQLIIIC